MICTIKKEFLPNKVIALNDGSLNLPEYVKSKPMLNGKATVYICSNYSCKEPTQDLNTALKMLSC